MKDFVAIDFESANDRHGSICSVGIVIVKNGEIVDKFYSLIRPRPNYYNYWHSKIHGLHNKDTDYAPSFKEVWGKVSKFPAPLMKALQSSELCRQSGLPQRGMKSLYSLSLKYIMYPPSDSQRKYTASPVSNTCSAAGEA